MSPGFTVGFDLSSLYEGLSMFMNTLFQALSALFSGLADFFNSITFYQ